MVANQQNISFYKGEDVVLNGVLSPVIDITGWSLQFAVQAVVGQNPILILKTTSNGGIQIINGPQSLFNVIIHSSDSAIPAGVYYFDVQRIDPGNHRELVIGTLTILPPNTAIAPS
jgi:hypothetical protein